MKTTFNKEVKEKLRALGVVAVYLFGSRAQGRAGPLSDFDFAVLTKKKGHYPGDKTYNELYDVFSPLCRPRTLKNDVIDIVFLRDTSLELKMHVIRYGRVLFDDDPRERVRLEQAITEEYCDYRPLLDLFDRAILASL